MFNKKAISPVVATALLLVVVVIAVVGFNSWFQGYSSSMFSDVEIKSSSNSELGIETLIGNTLYVKSGSDLNVTISKLSIGGVECTIDKNLSYGITELDVSSCLGSVSDSTPEIVIMTDDRIIEKSVYLEGSSVSLTQIPGNTTNKIQDPTNSSLYWVRDLSLTGQHKWSVFDDASYPEPIWNETSGSYIYNSSLGRVQSDYPAFMYCENLELDGYTNWRISSIDELLNLSDTIGWLETNFSSYGFTNYIDFFYWTSTEYDSDSAWTINFPTIMLSSYKSNEFYVKCLLED